MGTHQLFRADAHVDRDCILCEQFVRIHVFSRSNARNLGWRAKAGVGNLTGNHVCFVGICQRNNNIRIAGASAFKHIRVCGVADNGSNIEPVLKFAQHVRPHVDDSDLVSLLTRQVICRG